MSTPVVAVPARVALAPSVKRRGYPVVTATSRRTLAVLAMIVCVGGMGLVIGPRTLMPRDDHSENATTVRKIRAYVDDAYSMWSHATKGTCPARLADLDVFIGEANDVDAWGTAFVMTCADTATGAHTIIVRSAGEDRRFGTADDLWSDR